MKNPLLFTLSLFFVFGEIFAQNNNPSNDEIIAAHIRGKTEKDYRSLLTASGYIPVSCIKGFPQNLVGYAFNASMIVIDQKGNSDPFPEPRKVLYFDAEKIVSTEAPLVELSCPIVFTFTAKQGTSDVLVFIGESSYAYVYKVDKFDAVLPKTIDICYIDFDKNTMQKTFIFIILNNHQGK
jgi:hypothetical protein